MEALGHELLQLGDFIDLAQVVGPCEALCPEPLEERDAACRRLLQVHAVPSCDLDVVHER